jgi:hypothetical protein
MVPRNNLYKGPVMSAAKRALETGNAQYILIWIPEESENTLKNLLEKVCCERNTQKVAYDHIIDWYFNTINRLYSVYCGPRNLNISTKVPEEKKIIFRVEKACESGILKDITTVIQDTLDGEMRQRSCVCFSVYRIHRICELLPFKISLRG